MKRKFLSLILAAAVSTSLIVMPAASTNAIEDKANSISTLSQSSRNSISNEFIKLSVQSNGEFRLYTTGGDSENPNDDNKKLLFGNTNSESIKFETGAIDSFDSKWENVPAEENHIKSTYNSNNGIKVLRDLSLTNGINSSNADSVSLKYTLVNESSEAKTFSFRTMLDTMLGENDKAPFNVPGIGTFNTQTELSGNDVPEYWFAYDNLENPTVVSKYNFYNDSKPNKVQFTKWGSFVPSNDWDDNIIENSENGDSCVIMFWEDITLAPGESKIIESSYGVSSLNTQVNPDISVSVLNNNTIEANEDGTYPTYQTTATVKNSGDVHLNNVTLNVEIPEEFKNILSFDNESTSTLGNLDPEQSVNSDIQLNIAEGRYYDDIDAYFNVIVNSDSTETKTIRQNVTIKANAERSFSASLAGGENIDINPNEDNEYNPYKVDVTINHNDEENPDFNNEPNVHVDLEIPEEFKNDLTLLPLSATGEEDSINHFIPVAPGESATDGWNLAIKPSYEDRVITYNIKVTHGDQAPIVLTQTLNIKGLTPPPTPAPVKPDTPTKPEVKPSEPVKTGDPSNVAALLTTALTSLAGMITLRKKYNPKH